MSDLLSIGASGVKAYQSALTTVSENIANVGTTGYARRTTTLREVASTTGTYAGGNTQSGNGVVATGIGRASDEYANASVRSSSADLARTETGSTWLDKIDSALTDNKLGDRLTSFFTDSRSLAADPTSSGLRTQMLGSASTVAQAFSDTGTALDQAKADVGTQASGAAETLQGLANTLAKVNDGLGRVGRDANSTAQLTDQRDQILEQMSALVDVSASTDSYGRATVTVGGAQGATLVSGVNVGSVGYKAGSDGVPTFSITNGATRSVLTPAGGAMAGMVDGAQKLSSARTTLNALAGDFTSQINTIQQSGQDLQGDTGTAMFATGSSPTDITLAFSDPSKIAASTVGGGIRNADNLSKIEGLRTTTGAESGLNTLVTENATALNQRKTIADAQSSIRDGAVSTRDSASGVNLDNEAVDLMRFQQAYSASSRVIQTARETFQSIMDIQ